MRISDPLWPAVREVARMLLREEDVVVRAPAEYKPSFDQLCLHMADCMPARTTLPIFYEHHDDVVTIESTTSFLFAQCGGLAPSLDVIWLPGDSAASWGAIHDMCAELLDAGYPGCIGCVGSPDEPPWNETEHRKRVSNC